MLEGTLERIVFANPENAWSVVRLKVPGEAELVTAVGNLLAVQPGAALRLSGAWEKDARFGRQFRVSSYQTVTPSTLVGIERYLGSGLVRGIGKKLAQRLVRRFGLKTLEVIEKSPERIAEVRGIGKRRSEEIQRAFREQRGIQELMVFLQAHGVPTGLAVKIHKRYGEAAMAVVRETPFRLAAEVAGIGFASADRIAGAFGLPKDAPQRLEAALLHLLDDAAGRGHLFLPRRALLDGAVALLGVERARLEEAAAALAGRSEVVVEPLPRGSAAAGLSSTADEAVYLPALHAAETEIAERLTALTRAAPPPLELDVERALAWLEKRERIALAPEQRQAIRLGLTRKALVVTGGPGTGKTTLVRGIVAVLERKRQRVLLAAPTGRAAKRLAEATGREAATLHRLLEWDARTHVFARGRERPLECDLLIVDEASMLDAPLAAQVLRAVPDPARLILVGDVDQLPSVGPGRVLADLIHSGAVEVARLTTIFRQAERSLIVTNAHRVQRGEMPLLLPPAGEGADFFFLERERPEEVLDTLRELVAQRIPRSFGFHPLEEVQVLTPMNRGLLGTASLNGVLRELLNPAGAGAAAAGSRLAQAGLRVGDKVMQVRNNYDLEVFNGDLGRVATIDEDGERVEVLFDGRRVAYDAAALDELVLAYACSIHKSQGSEYPCVVVPLHSQHYVMLQRNLLYTALTRARRLAILVGEKRALRVAVGNARTRERHTLLAERLASLGSG